MNDPEGVLPGDGPGPGALEVMMDQDQAGVEAEALQVGEDVPEDQQHAEDVQEMLEDMMPSPPEPEAAGGHHGPALLPQPQLGAVPRVGGGALLLRHASQSSLDESSQKFGHKLGEHKRPPYRNLGHPGKVSCHEAVIQAAHLVAGPDLLPDIHHVAGRRLLHARPRRAVHRVLLPCRHHHSVSCRAQGRRQITVKYHRALFRIGLAQARLLLASCSSLEWSWYVNPPFCSTPTHTNSG